MQEKAGCIIGKDYPKPIVDHDKVRKINIERMAKAYAKNKEMDNKVPTPKKRPHSEGSDKKSKKRKN